MVWFALTTKEQCLRCFHIWKTKLFIGDINGVVHEEPLLLRLYAQHYAKAFDISGNHDFGCPFRLIAGRGYGYGHDIRGLVKTIEDAICADNGRVANMNIGGVLAGGGGLSCKLQAGVGALHLI